MRQSTAGVVLPLSNNYVIVLVLASSEWLPVCVAWTCV